MTYPISLRVQFLLYIFMSGAILVIDRITKLMALHLPEPHKITSFLSYELVLNRGISWGILHSTSSLTFILISSIIGLIIVGIAAHAYLRLSAGHWIWAEALIISGAVGNMIDRLVYGGVVDFIHLSYGSWSFPVFNIADVAVVTGVLMLFWEFYQE